MCLFLAQCERVDGCRCVAKESSEIPANPGQSLSFCASFSLPLFCCLTPRRFSVLLLVGGLLRFVMVSLVCSNLETLVFPKYDSLNNGSQSLSLH